MLDFATDRELMAAILARPHLINEIIRTIEAELIELTPTLVRAEPLKLLASQETQAQHKCAHRDCPGFPWAPSATMPHPCGRQHKCAHPDCPGFPWPDSPTKPHPCGASDDAA